jgi:flavin-binding protein dodecin
MPEYTVSWHIDVTAKDFKDAARQALEIQRDTLSTATVFEVCENGAAKDAKAAKAAKVFIDLARTSHVVTKSRPRRNSKSRAA